MTVPTMLAPGAAIPQPSDFRVYFEPGEDRLLWDRDRTHHPAQLTTLEGEFVARFAAHGMGHAFERYAVPVAGVRARAIHGYLYTAFEPLQGSPEEIARHAARGEAAILTTVAAPADRVGGRVAARDPRPHRGDGGGGPAARAVDRRPRRHPRGLLGAHGAPAASSTSRSSSRRMSPSASSPTSTATCSAARRSTPTGSCRGRRRGPSRSAATCGA